MARYKIGRQKNRIVLFKQSSIIRQYEFLDEIFDSYEAAFLKIETLCSGDYIVREIED